MEKASLIEAKNGKDNYKYITPYTLNGVLSGGVASNKYRVGDVIISTNSEDPSIQYGGTWQLLCPGRTLVCIDTSDSAFNTVRKTGGAKTHTLTVNEMPSHTHNMGAVRQYANGNGNSPWITDRSAGYGNEFQNVSYAGGGQPHNNLQPYMVVYMWEKIA